MQRIDEKREASGQNAMLEQVRTWQQKEFLKDMAEAGHFVATCYSAEEAIEVIKKYLSLNSWRMNDVMIVMGRASGKQDAIEKMVMDIPNNSILKNGEIKESKPRKK